MGEVTVLAWDLCHNAVGRAWLLADALRHAGYAAEVAGPMLTGTDVWAPLRHSHVPIRALRCESWGGLREMADFVEDNPRHTVIVSKPRFSSMFLGLLYKKRWGARVIVDVDDWELAFVNEREPIDPRIFAAGFDRDVSSPSNPFWTRLAEGMLGLADAITVSNASLQQRFGGVIVRHLRNEAVFDRGRYDSQAMRRKHGLPATGRLVMFLGTARRHKGVMEALRLVLASGADDLVLCVLDAFGEPAYRRELVQAGGNRLALLPPLPFQRLPELLSAASFVCLPQAGNSVVSAYQLPAKLTDAMAMRVPVMMSPTAAVADLAARGLFLNPGALDAAAFAKAVAMPQAQLDAITARAHRIFLEEFSYSAGARVLGDCLRQAGNKPLPDWAGPLLAFTASIRPQQALSTVPANVGPTHGAPVSLGKAWAGNTLNTAVFRHHGILTVSDLQFCAFYVDSARLRIVRRGLIDGSVVVADFAGRFKLGDAHNIISLGCDRQGFLHMAFGHHASSLRYCRSLKPLDASEWTGQLPMSGAHEDQVTYPAFLMSPAGDPLLMLYRDGVTQCGKARLKAYDEAGQTWSDLDPELLSGASSPSSSNPYWNHPAFGADGSLHLSFTWRTPVIEPEGRINNIDVDYARSRDQGRSWETSRGRALGLPITQANSETVWPVSAGGNLMNQCGMAVDSAGHPHIAFYSDDADGVMQYQHLWYDGCDWHHNFISTRREAFVLAGSGTLRVPMSRPEIVIDMRDRVYVIYRADVTGQRMVAQRLLPPRYLPDEAGLRVLWNEPLGFAEPVLDRLRWKRDGVLSMLVQKNDQPDHEATPAAAFEPVFIADWALPELWGD